jgi:hypothetical protein
MREAPGIKSVAAGDRQRRVAVLAAVFEEAQRSRPPHRHDCGVADTVGDIMGLLGPMVLKSAWTGVAMLGLTSP